MRILHFVQRYWPARGGAETYLGEISGRLASEGHQVTVATTDAFDFELFWDRGRRRLAEPGGLHRGVRILRFPVRHLPVSQLAYPACRRLLWLLSACLLCSIVLFASLAKHFPYGVRGSSAAVFFLLH